MNIGVDMHVLQGIYQGSRSRLKNIYAEAARIDVNGKYHFFVNDPDGIGEEWKRRGAVIGFGTNSRIKRLLISAPLHARRAKLDLFHFQFISPPWCACPIVLTVHDLLFETHPWYFTKGFVLRSKALVRLSSRKAAHIFTVSNYSREKIQEIYGIREERISVIPSAVDAEIFNPMERDESKKLVLERWGLRDFLLTVGRLEPRKNHRKLIRAYRLLTEEMKDVPELVIVGQRDFLFKEIFEEISSSGLEDKVKIIEGLGDEWLPHMYRSALCFVFPSFAEGFGLPPLEAMACGCPAISSNTTSMPEILGDASLMFDPKSEEDIAAKMKQVIESSSMIEKLSENGLKRAQEFTWQKSARIMLNDFKRICS